MNRLARLALPGLLLLSGRVLAAPPPATAARDAETAAPTPSLADIQTFTQVFELVKQAYVEPVGDHQLMQSALRGMLAGLDPHSEFLDREQLHDLNEDTTGAYAGLGIEVVAAKHQLVIITPLDGGPAKRAGIVAGDVIVAIDGVPVRGDAVDTAIEKLRGPLGSKIALAILHQGARQPVVIKLVRQRIQVSSVQVKQLAPGLAWLRISEFQDRTTDELTRALAKLQQAHGPLRGAVLDLRSNPGGLLNSAVGVADALLDRGAIVSTRGRLPQSELEFSATPGDLLHGAPLVVLVDNGTASAAEIVTGALQDNHRALVLGRRTFGKGSVQSILPLPDGSAVKLTTALYYTPSGISIQVVGIRPDIALADFTLASASAPDTDEHEGDLGHHLPGQPPAPADADTGELAQHDYALAAALQVLEGLALSRRNATPASARSSD